MRNNIFSNVYITKKLLFFRGYYIIWSLDMKFKNVCQLEILLQINLMYNGKDVKSFLFVK